MRRKLLACISHNPIVALIDVLLVNLGLVLSFHLRWPNVGPHEQNLRAYTHEAPLLSIAAVTIFFILDLYSDWVRKSKTDLVYSIVGSSCILAFVTTSIVYWDRQFAFPRSVILISPLAVSSLLLVYRLSVRSLRNALTGPARALVICNDPVSGQEIASQINENQQDWIRVEAYLQAKDIVLFYEMRSKFDTIIIVENVERKAELIDFCAAIKKQVMVVPDFFELSMVGAHPLQIGDLLLFNINPPHLSPGQRMLKRILDLVVATAMFVLTSPLLVILSIIIRLSSKGPVLFHQERVGCNGDEYTLYKFRSMVEDAEEKTGPVLATENDPRITRLGKFLRGTRLDELPQLLNVIKGDMSLVGPRPERAHFVREFCLTIPSYQYRMLVKPGITGLAQVYGRYSTTPVRKLRFDLMYIYDYSLVLDLKILLKTILVVLKRGQAAGVSEQEEVLNQVSRSLGVCAVGEEERVPGQEFVFKK